MTVDQEIARKAQIERIDSIAQSVGLSADDIIPFGHYRLFRFQSA